MINIFLIIINWFKRLTIRGLLSLVWIMPYSMAVALGRAIGLTFWAIDSFHRGIAEAQMRAALGHEYRRGMSLNVFMNISDSLIDIIRFAHMSEEKARSMIRIRGQEHLNAAMADGRGIMFITAHVGNWEIILQTPRLTGIDLSIMADRRNNAEIESLIQRVRSSGRTTILPPKGGMIAKLIAELKANRHICFFVDKRGKRRNNFHRYFFNMPAPTSPAPAFIALKTNCLVLPVYAIKNGYNFELCFSPAVDTRSFGTDADMIDKLDDSIHSEAVQKLSDYMQEWVESVIRRHPVQWIWQYPRWLHRSEMRHILRAGIHLRQYVEDQGQIPIQ